MEHRHFIIPIGKWLWIWLKVAYLSKALSALFSCDQPTGCNFWDILTQFDDVVWFKERCNWTRTELLVCLSIRLNALFWKVVTSIIVLWCWVFNSGLWPAIVFLLGFLICIGLRCKISKILIKVHLNFLFLS